MRTLYLLLIASAACGLSACGSEAPDEPTPRLDLGSLDIRPGDVLVAVDGQPVATREEALRQVLKDHRGDELIEITIERNGERLERSAPAGR